jgi:fatty acid desaturase
LKEEVFKILKGREFATRGYLFRTAIYLGFFFTTSYYWTTTTELSYTILILHPIAAGFMALNISHDANHGSISRKYIWLNDVLSMANDLVGGTKWLWQQSHNGHHAYTNTEKDPDSIASEPAVLFHPYPVGSPKRRWFHNLQALYILPLVSLYWLATVFNPEVVVLKEHTAVLAGINLDNDYFRARRKYAVLVRLLYIYVYIVRVFINNGFTWDTCGKIILHGCLGSMVVAKALFNHNFDESNRVNYNEKEENGELQDWYKKQAESASTYGGYISGYLAGGLNYQIEHHLFPRMNSAWFPYISPAVRRVCEKHNVQYAYFPTIIHQIISFSKFIHKSGTCTMERQWKKID